MDKLFIVIITVLSLAQLAEVHADSEQSSTTAGRATVASWPLIKRNETRIDAVSLDDLLHTLHYSLNVEIPSGGPILGPRLDALQKYLKAVSDYFPEDPGTVGAYFRELRRWVQSKTKIEVEDFKSTLKRLDRFLSPWHRVDLTKWDDCKGTLPGLRGYPCGLWRLFHSLTLMAIHQTPYNGPFEGIHAYVKEFFQCQECKEHFLHMVDRDNILAHKYAATQALWLWNAHNEMNMRIKGDPREDPGYPKEYYPSKKHCPKCFDANDRYIERRVLGYLRRIYNWPITSSVRRFMEFRVDLVKIDGKLYLRQPTNDHMHQ